METNQAAPPAGRSDFEIAEKRQVPQASQAAAPSDVSLTPATARLSTLLTNPQPSTSGRVGKTAPTACLNLRYCRLGVWSYRPQWKVRLPIGSTLAFLLALPVHSDSIQTLPVPYPVPNPSTTLIPLWYAT